MLAEELNGEIISADSRQIFKHLDIGTAKPSQEDRTRVRHHFIDVLDPKVEYSAGQYGEEVQDVFDDVAARGKVPILVGGSGLYVKAAIDGLFGGPGKDPDIRGRLEEQLRVQGLDALIDQLRKKDPDTLSKMKEITPRRVIRALEVFSVTGKPMSSLHASQPPRTDFRFQQVCLVWDRSELYARINHRVDEMMRAGLVEEVRGLLTMGYSRQLNALNTVGYKEVFDHLEGATDHETMVELIKRNTRRFAKRQVTWFGADKRIRGIPMSAGRELISVSRKIADSYRRVARA